MAIEFRCDHCRQRLAAPERRAAKVVRCPRCREPTRVPSPAAVGGGEKVEHPPRPLHVVGSEEAASSPEEPPVISLDAALAAPGRSPDTFVVSRSTIFVQGVMLALTAAFFFLAGMWIGRSSDRRGAAAATPCRVSGRVMWRQPDARRGTGDLSADAGAVVMLLPSEHRPETKLDPSTLRPDAARPSDLNPGVRAIRQWGGDYVRADQRGQFRLRVPRGGTYFLLVISAHAGRAQTRPRHRDLAQLGRYFLPAIDLLEDRAYNWTELRLDGDRRLDVIALEDER